MFGKINLGSRLFNVGNSLLMLVLVLVTLYPLYHVAMGSISNGVEMMTHRGLLLRPLGFTLEGYNMVFKNPMIIKGYINTLFIVIVGTLLNLLMTSVGAYSLSRSSLYYKRTLTLFIVFTMYFSGGLIPNYLTVRMVGIDNTLWALIIPGIIGTTNLIIMRTSFAAIPESLCESATIDGANDITILFRIILPLSKPIIAVMVMYYGVGHWNSWFSAMIYLRERTKFPLQLILREILIQDQTAGMVTNGYVGDMQSMSETLKYATIMVATIPILIIYPFAQKYFTKGVMIGAIKG